MNRLYTFIVLALGLFLASLSVNAQDTHTEAHAEAAKEMDVKKVIFDHVSDAHEWHFFTLGETHVSIPLPMILYSPENGLSMFCASKFGHEGHREAYEGYTLNENGKVESVDGSSFYNFSITKNIASMFLSVIILLVIMISVAKKYKQRGTMTAPKGLQNAIEPLITFVYDEVAKPNLGKKAAHFMPLLLTFFFFIWINNLLGLLPGSANLTGNIAVTACLALISFVVLLARSNKHFWGHLLNPPGVAFGIKLLLVPIEIISLFIKHLALTIRLFANVLAGHIIILSIVCMIFIFGKDSPISGYGFSIVSLAFSIFMFCLELLVGAIQAFIFTTLSAVFIGQAIEEPHHGHDNEIIL